MTDPVQDALALLRSLHRDFDFWIVKKVGQKGYHWSAKRKSDGQAVVADDPEELVEALRRLPASELGLRTTTPGRTYPCC